ncbi:hypothetical protein DY703_05130 [Salmonella enterica]|nr:hypothetical protein [Salmonella enterica]EBQ9478321.1 hypothetical protein [Salmonella enterica subsp. enterica serovar Kokomlemle]EGJ5835232.1 hypothetical protein [Salmonella enterica]EHQ5241560.1 hypothetical protein [Salmonella enterica]
MSLPLRDYYPIGRAAQLLECTVDDLIHWAMVGCIRLYLKVEHSYGLLNGDSLYDIVGHHDFNDVTDGTDYKEKLNELDELSSDDSDEKDYYLERAKIIRDAMKTYMFKYGDVKCFDEIGMRYSFSQLTYFFDNQVTEDLAEITCMGWISQVYKREPDEYKKIKDIVSDDDEPYIVRMRGFFGLGERFFHGYNFDNELIPEQEDGFDNPVYMPESNLLINIIVDDSVSFNINDLFVLKNDFIIIQEASKNGVEPAKKYNHQRISGNHVWWKHWTTQHPNQKMDNPKLDESNKKSNSHIKEMHSTKRESVLEAALYIKVNYPELCKNNTKWAEAIHDHSYARFGGDCPLSIESTKRLLGKATKKQKDKNRKTAS